MSLDYTPLHTCEPPYIPELGREGGRHHVYARWRCHCGSRWVARAEFLWYDRVSWERVSPPSRRWQRKARYQSEKGNEEEE